MINPSFPCSFCKIPTMRSGLMKCATCTKDNYLYLVSTSYDTGRPIFSIISIKSKDYDLIIKSEPNENSYYQVIGGIYTFKYQYDLGTTELIFDANNERKVLFSTHGQIVTPSTAVKKLETLLTFL